MTIQQCKYVLKVAETGSFNEAANSLFIAQSTLSLSIKALEDELGIKIFERQRNGVCFTDEGAEFVTYATRIVENAELISDRYNAGNLYKSFTVTTQHYDFVADIFTKMINESASENYKFSLRETKTFDVIREVETAYSNIGIMAVTDADYEIMKRYLVSKGLTFTPFLKARPHVFIREGHPLANCETLSLAVLKDYPFIQYEQGRHNASLFTEEITDAFHSKKYIEISDRATLMNVLLTTDAYTVGTGIMPSALNEGGKILSIPFESEKNYIIGYILNGATEKNTESSHSVDKFIKLLTESTKNI